MPRGRRRRRMGAGEEPRGGKPARGDGCGGAPPDRRGGQLDEVTARLDKLGK